MLDGEQIQGVREEKDLGIVIDDDLKLQKQTAAAISKASQMLAPGSRATICRQPQQIHTATAIPDGGQAVPGIW